MRGAERNALLTLSDICSADLSRLSAKQMEIGEPEPLKFPNLPLTSHEAPGPGTNLEPKKFSSFLHNINRSEIPHEE
jgi:hypothetical protein